MLDPAHVHVLRIHYAPLLLPLLAIALVVDLGWAAELGVATGLFAGLVAIALALAVWLLPGRRYRGWRYDPREDELVVKHGLMVRKHTVVPFGRVQHIDIAQGPVQRPFGLATLVLNTAGTRGAGVRVPGLARDEAERLRDHVRAKIRQDLQ